ncbi:MAG: NUDIX domain-containing protein [Rubrivivax sp.]|nr:NUDIX domain-containing protein [Pyrinomonadaceae bacterium]
MKPGYTPVALIYKFVLYPFWNLYVRLFRTDRSGVRCLVEYEGKVLLVRNTYGSMEWNMPGGLVGDGEQPEKASRRETEEEVGVTLGALRFLGRTGNTLYFYGKAEAPGLEIARGEIYDAQWFEWDSLPKPLSPEVKRVERLYRLSDARRL